MVHVVPAVVQVVSAVQVEQVVVGYLRKGECNFVVVVVGCAVAPVGHSESDYSAVV